MAGVVNSEFHTNDSGFDLPLNSRYIPIKDTIASWASGEAKPKGCSSHEFAEALLGDIIGSKRPSVYKGPYAGVIKFITNWLPTALVVSNYFHDLSVIFCLCLPKLNGYPNRTNW